MLDRLNARLKGYRTIIVNAIASIPIIIEITMQVAIEVFRAPEFIDVLPDNWIKAYTLGVIILNAYMRRITTTPLGRRE